MEFEDVLVIICLGVIAVYPGLHIYLMARARRAQPLWHPMGRVSELLAYALSAPIEPLPRRPVYGPFSSEASNKAIALLKRWLSPEQRRELEKRGSFDVVGSHTGRRYRIYPGKLNNVRILQDNFEVAALCFAPADAGFLPDPILARAAEWVVTVAPRENQCRERPGGPLVVFGRIGRSCMAANRRSRLSGSRGRGGQSHRAASADRLVVSYAPVIGYKAFGLGPTP